MTEYERTCCLVSSFVCILQVEVRNIRSFDDLGQQELAREAETEDDEHHAFFIQKW